MSEGRAVGYTLGRVADEEEVSDNFREVLVAGGRLYCDGLGGDFDIE